MSEPSNFSWMIDDLLAGSGYPSDQSHFEYFTQQGINHIINLTQHSTPSDIIVPKGINLISIPIIDFRPPTVQQITDFIRIVDDAKSKGERLVCHCQWGRGRTGTMLAAYLVKEGIAPADAIDKVRQKRPFSIETTEQEQTVFKFYEHLQNSGVLSDS